jgi:hypothetical protein
MMYALAKLSGISADAEGWTISPKIPHETYSFSCSLFGVDVCPERISGYVCLPVIKPLSLTIELPEKITKPIVFVDGHKVAAKMTGSALKFSLISKKEQKVTWEIVHRI